MIIHDRYRVIKLIGQGGFGKTFIAVDEGQTPQYICAIEQFWSLEPTPESLEKATKLFRQKALRLKELGKHPQIPMLLDYFEEDERFYLVQEFIDGNNLAEIVEKEGVFNEERIWKLLDDLLPLLKFIHENQVIHRDIKPENIIRRNSDKCLAIVDFATAKLVTEIDAIVLEPSVGSAEFASPEQTKGKAVFASDLYSLGATCIYLLTGISTFDLFDISNDCWVWREYVNGEVSDRLSRTLDKLLQNAVDRRYNSADEVIREIKTGGILTLPKNLVTKTSPLELFATLVGHSGLFAAIDSLAIDPTGNILASGSDDKTIKLWKLETGEEIATLTGHSHFVKSVAFSLDGTILASGSDDKTIKLWNVSTGEEIRTLSGHSRAVRSIAFCPYPPKLGEILASGSWDKTIKLWDINTGEILFTLVGHQLQVTSVAFSPSNAAGEISGLLASTSFDRTVRLWNLASNSHLISTHNNLTLGKKEGFPKLNRILAGHLWPVFTVAFSPQGNILATGSDDKTVKLWDLKIEQEIRTLLGHSWTVSALAFSPDGEILFSGSWDKTIKIWRVNTGEKIATLAEHSDSITALAISPNGKILASASKDSTIKLWRSLTDRF